VAERNEIVAVYAAGIIQGVALVTFPAASAIFISPSYYRLSSTEYGGMFVPQAIMAIALSLMGGGLTRHLGIKRIYLLGLVADLLAMMFLVLTDLRHRKNISVSEIDTYKSAKTIWHYIFARLTG
jgi:MFS-type transporter involved in bile tolerance (Atg22 family)